MPPLSSADLKDTARLFVDVRVGAAERRASLTLSPLALASVGRAHALIDAIVDGHHPELSDPDTIVATLERLIRRVTTRGTSNRWENGLIEMRARELSDWVARVSAGRDPLHTETGVIEFAVRSNLDGSPQALRLHVPAAYGAGSTKRFPLVIALHGYNGSARGIMNAFLDTQRTEPRADVEGFVAAPYAHGNAFYRGPGESNVMQVLDWLTRTYPIDVNRISITGVSMGGTGAAHIALRHASTFSAAAPLCGYQSYFVRRDTSDRPLREWELGRMHHWSPASWAENGRNLPLYVAHGTRDLPLANSRVLVDRYNALDYSIVDEWPDAGHAVWLLTYDKRRMWGWLAEKRRPSSPESVTVKTDALRYGKQHWVEILALRRPGAMGTVSATRTSAEFVIVQTEGVEAFELDRTHLDNGKQTLTLQLDGTYLTFGPSEPVRVRREGEAWTKLGATLPFAKRSGLEGPLSDIYAGPVVFTYGTQDFRFTRANREVAAWFARQTRGDVEYAVIADSELDAETERQHGIVAVGSPGSHLLLRAVAEQLPIRVDDGSVSLGTRRFEGNDVGATFIVPNPRHADHYLAVVTAPTPAGIWRAMSLPRLLPDFVVYDGGLADAADEQVLSRGHVLGAGHFDNLWRLPATFDDPFAPSPVRASPPAPVPSPPTEPGVGVWSPPPMPASAAEPPRENASSPPRPAPRSRDRSFASGTAGSSLRRPLGGSPPAHASQAPPPSQPAPADEVYP